MRRSPQEEGREGVSWVLEDEKEKWSVRRGGGITFTFHVDPTHVMGLYPDLLPTDYRKQLQYPNPLPVLSGAELEKAHLALIDYLTQVSMMQRGVREFTWGLQYLLLYGGESRALYNTVGTLHMNTLEVWVGTFLSASFPCSIVPLSWFLPNVDTRKHVQFLVNSR